MRVPTVTPTGTVRGGGATKMGDRGEDGTDGKGDDERGSFENELGRSHGFCFYDSTKTGVRPMTIF